MVLQTFNQTLSLRLARLRRHAIAHPEGPTWLWQMRIRILEYLVSRYEDDSSSSLTQQVWNVADAQDRQRASDALAFTMLDTVEEDLSERTLGLTARALIAADMGDEAPPRARSEFSPVLESLCEINEASRILTGINPPLDSVWNWWRDHWCCAPSPSIHR